MKEIIYDLLCVGKSHKTFAINPEVRQTKTSCSDNIRDNVGGISPLNLSVFALPEDEYRFAGLLGDR